MTIMIVEDNNILAKELSRLLEQNNYETIITYDIQIIMKQLNYINLILMDVNLPYEDGYKLCQRIKKQSNIPIIFVTSRDKNNDELLSIEAGGIDFVTKPYNKIILLEKIKRALKLTNPINSKELNKNGYILDLHLSILKFQDKEIELTRNEFRILYYFFINDNRIITKDELLEYLWNDKYYLDENILVVNINRLRKKAEEIGINDLIKTAWKKGYYL